MGMDATANCTNCFHIIDSSVKKMPEVARSTGVFAEQVDVALYSVVLVCFADTLAQCPTPSRPYLRPRRPCLRPLPHQRRTADQCALPRQETLPFALSLSVR